jgi:hypothetical protein
MQLVLAILIRGWYTCLVRNKGHTQGRHGGGLVTVWDINIPVAWGFDSEGFADIEIPQGQGGRNF